MKMTKFTVSQIIGMLNQKENGQKVADICREHGNSQPSFYWELNIDELYDIYRANSFINTTVIKNATGGRVNSPSVAVLMAIGCIDDKGNRVGWLG